MAVEMYSRIGGKALPKDNKNTVKVINFVDEEGQPVAFGQGPAGPVTKAEHIDPDSGTLPDVIKALINAGLMKESA